MCKNLTFVNRLKKVVVCSTLFFLPFIILDSPWIYRNYTTFGIFEPFNRYGFDDVEMSFRRFMIARGESTVWWDQKSAGCYFKITDQPCNFIISESFISEHSSIEETENLRIRFHEFQLSETKSKQEAIAIVNEFDRLTENYKSDKPLNFYLLSRLRITKSFMFDSGTYFLPFNYAESNLILKLIKLSQSFFYYMSLVFGVVGLLFLSSKHKLFIFLFTIPLFLIAFFPLIMGYNEQRYFFHFFPFALMGLVYLIEKSFIQIKSRINKVKKSESEIY